MRPKHRSHPPKHGAHADGPKLVALLAGELPPREAERLTARLAREPELAAAWERLRGTWLGLELPPASAVPPGFAHRVASRARASAAEGADLRAAPPWMRAAAALALAAGLAVGVGVGLWQSAAEEPQLDVETSLAETYWEALAEGVEVEP